MNFFFIAKIGIVLFFLLMFMRGSRLVWGIGLLTVTSALLLDSFRQVFGAPAADESLGAFEPVIGGALLAGGALWLWGLLRPLVAGDVTQAPVVAPVAVSSAPWNEGGADEAAGGDGTVFDRKMLYDQIRHRLGPDDVLDLIFDLDINENDALMAHTDISQNIVRLMDLAAARGQMGELALAVERVLTPPTRDQLPRRKKLSAETPRAALRHFLLANYGAADLATLAVNMKIDWELLEGAGKKGKARNLLLYLYRRNRLDDLLAQIAASETASEAAVEKTAAEAAA